MENLPILDFALSGVKWLTRTKFGQTNQRMRVSKNKVIVSTVET